MRRCTLLVLVFLTSLLATMAGCVVVDALFGTPAGTSAQYRPALAGEQPDATLWVQPPAAPVVVTDSGTATLTGPVPFESGSLGLIQSGTVDLPGSPGYIQSADQVLTATGAAGTPWGGIVHGVITLALLIWGATAQRKAAARIDPSVIVGLADGVPAAPVASPSAARFDLGDAVGAWLAANAPKAAGLVQAAFEASRAGANSK